jgi:hypothetical protein
MIQSNALGGDISCPFIDLKLETNTPGGIGTALCLYTQPLDLVCRPATLTSILDFFTKPSALILDDLTQYATSKATQMAQQSRTSLVHAVTTHQSLDVAMYLKAPKVMLLSENDTSALLIDMGSLNIRSLPFQTNVDVSSLSTSDLYETFDVECNDMQIITLSRTNGVSRRFVSPQDIFFVTMSIHLLPSAC